MINYRLCDQVVTVYHRAQDGTVVRTVYPHAYLEYRTTSSAHKTAGNTVSKIGMSEQTVALLVIPWQSEPCPVEPGDKVLRGEGPETVDWARFTPALVPGVAVMRYAVLHHYRGVPCHLEAGG